MVAIINKLDSSSNQSYTVTIAIATALRFINHVKIYKSHKDPQIW